MTTLTESSARPLAVPSFALAVGVLALVTIVRLIGMRFSVVDLFYDESQYWAWSRELAFGYYSKPPLLAWIIALAEHVCGSSEACIRAPAPILYFGMSLLVYAVARLLYDDRVALFSAVSICVATGTAFSARIISTDVPLLFFWALALFAYVKLWVGADRYWAVVLGIALGLGLLAKYAMLYFLLGVALAAVLDADARRLLRERSFWYAAAIAAVIVAPNIVWNLENGLATFRHTGDNIGGAGLHPNPLRALEFLASQFAVFGPILFAVLLVAIAWIGSSRITRADRLMLAFAIPPLAIITATAIASRAFANWAGTAFVSGIVVAVALMVRWQAWKCLAASIGIGVFAQAGLLVGDAIATRLHLPVLAQGDVYHRTLGWRALGENAGRLARQAGARSIVAEYRNDVASLLYYWRDQPEVVLAWPAGPIPTHHFEITRALSQASPQPILFVSYCGSPARLQDYFSHVEPAGSFRAATGPTTGRTYHAFKVEGWVRPLGPLGACR
jgi:4-amino-4-deoxy-L-arabinose transferase-like glycosyltransferase